MVDELKPAHDYIPAIEKEPLAGSATEHTHRPALKALIESLTAPISSELTTRLKSFNAASEA